MNRPGTNSETERSQVGIGTLIVFIAMVLVAAIAAGVLIHTAGFLQTQAEGTGTESTKQVADAVNVITEVGEVQNNDEVHEIRIGVQRAAGAGDINLAELTILYVGENDSSNIIVDNVDGERATGDEDPSKVEAGVRESSGDYRYGVEIITAENEDDLVMTENSDRYEIVINTSGLEGGDDAGPNLGPAKEGDSIQLSITTGDGAQTDAFLQVPDSLSDAEDGSTVSL
jgi:flagellin FlaB